MFRTEGFLTKTPKGNYAIKGINLACGARLEIMFDRYWIPVIFDHDGDNYYIRAHNISFYPRKVYAKYLYGG